MRRLRVPTQSYAARKRAFQERYPVARARGLEHFVVRSVGGLIPEGHERLTREAVSGIAGYGPADVAALIEGVRRPDTESLANHFRPSQQPRHSLRQAYAQPQRDALLAIRRHFLQTHRRAVSAASRVDAMRLAGEVLHLLQDSYSPAHVERRTVRGAIGPIIYIRYFGLDGPGAPLEHRVPFDPRDLVIGAVSPEQRAAINASREYLGLFRARLGVSPPARDPAIAQLVARHLSASRTVAPGTGVRVPA